MILSPSRNLLKRKEITMKYIITFFIPFLLLAQNVNYPDTLYTNKNIIYPCIITKINNDNLQIKNNYGISSTTSWPSLSKVILNPLGIIYTKEKGFYYDIDSLIVYLNKRPSQNHELSDSTNKHVINNRAVTEKKRLKKSQMQFTINVGTLFFLRTNFSGSGPHEPNEIELATDYLWAKKGLSGFAIMGRFFNIGNSFIGAEFGIYYNRIKFSAQNVELSYGSFSVTLTQPSFNVNSFSFQTGLLISTKSDWGSAFKALRPYFGIGFTYSKATVSDINLEPEYGVGGHSDAQGFGYMFKSGAEYVIKNEYIIALETYYHSSNIHLDKFRSYNIDGIDGTLNILLFMIYIGKIF